MTLKKLGRYQLLRVLGQGAMGVVYEGRDPRLGRRVAIKTVQAKHLSQSSTDAYEARFRTEALSAARLQHPHIVSVYDCARDGDTAFLVMEYIRGQDLKQRLDEGAKFTVAQSLRIGRELLGALEYAHRQGIIHRDIKPANLLIEPDGRLKLADFGVARIIDSPDTTRCAGSLVGTLKYMAPEQVQGKVVDTRADLFAVGVVLYQLLTGVRPFEADNDFSVMQQVVSRVPLRPSALNPKLPRALDAILSRALAKDPADRFPTAGAFADALMALSPAEADAASGAGRASEAAGNGHAAQTRAGALAQGQADGADAGAAHDDELACWKELDSAGETRFVESFLARFPAFRHTDLARRRLLLWRTRTRAALRGEQTSTWPTWDGLPAQRAPRWGVITGGCALALIAMVAAGWSGREPEPALLAAGSTAAVAFAPAVASRSAHVADTPSRRLGAPPAPTLAPVAGDRATQSTVASAAATPPLRMIQGAADASSQSKQAAADAAQPPRANVSAPASMPVTSATASSATRAIAQFTPARTLTDDAAARARPPAVDRDERVNAQAPVAVRHSAAGNRGGSAKVSTRRMLAQPRESAAVCAQHVLLSRQWCLQRECVKPIFDQAQACKLFRQHARLREEARFYN